MFSLAEYVFMIVLPTWAVATLLVRWLEGAAQRAETRGLSIDLVSNAADISMRIDHLEQVIMRPDGVHIPERSR